ncbi:hypothetical protein RchiOBHm_Chr2g0159781 [Rosa chinensis]|uniref:Late embryogenesis abundant protein, LEA-14 n=1 Tax=Rosa chinensis TaxID=74649 RepID=A0A2P6S2C4_ROSCH|nr:hypothetical protein RchiOBHm_Chr2g0159781 [Rosa chinensis]
MISARSPSIGLKICCLVTAIFVIIALVVITILALTVFKPKQPKINARPVGLENIQYTLFPNVTLNVTLSMLVTINNRNYGSFSFKNATTYVTYHGTVVGLVLMEHAFVPAGGKINITTSVDLMGDKLISNPHFMEDVNTGIFNLISIADLHGKVTVLKFMKFSATTFSTCDISFSVKSERIDSKCKSKLKM